MTKKELIKTLEQLPDDLDIVLYNDDVGLFYEVRTIEKKTFKYKGEDNIFEAIAIW